MYIFFYEKITLHDKNKIIISYFLGALILAFYYSSKHILLAIGSIVPNIYHHLKTKCFFAVSPLSQGDIWG